MEISQIKLCSFCDIEKPISEFWKDRTTKDGFCHRCIMCKKKTSKNRKTYFDARKSLKREYDKQYNASEKIQIKERRKHLKKYGLTIDSYAELLNKQNGACAICQSKDPKSSKIKNFPIDHCHNTGKIRGLLCSSCNRAIGLFQDNPELCIKAAEYLKK